MNERGGSDDAEYVVDTLTAVESAEIPYCILRKFDFLEGGDPGSDIDVAVPSTHRKELEEALSSRGFVRANRTIPGHAFFHGYPGDGRRIIELDVHWDGPSYNGLPIVDPVSLLERRRRRGDCWIPSSEDLFVQLVFHCLLLKEEVTPAYESSIQELTGEVDSNRCLSQADSLFGSAGRRCVEQALAGNISTVIGQKWPVVRGGLRENPRRVPTFVRRTVFHYQFHRPVQKQFRKTPLSKTPLVVILGPDGSGKSTLARNLEEYLEENGRTVTVGHYGINVDASGFVKIPKRILKRFSGGAVSGTNRTTDSAPSRKAGWKAIPHVLDISYRYLGAQSSNSDVIISDRFIHDVGVKVRTGDTLRRFFRAYESDPFFGLFLTADGKTLAARSEYSAEAIDEMNERYSRFGPPFPRIDAGQSETAVLEDALEELLVHGDLLRYC